MPHQIKYDFDMDFKARFLGLKHLDVLARVLSTLESL